MVFDVIALLSGEIASILKKKLENENSGAAKILGSEF